MFQYARAMGVWVVGVDANNDHGDDGVVFGVLLVLTPHTGVGVWVSDWCISTSQLRTLLCFHIWPINPVVYWTPQGKSHLEAGFPLRCFQRLSFPNVANQPCTWRYNWHTRGSSVPVLSY